MILDAVLSAALRILLLTVFVQLGLWALGVRNPRRLLTGWTAVLLGSLAMPLLQDVVTMPRSVVTALPHLDQNAPGLLARTIAPVLGARMPVDALTFPWRTCLAVLYTAVAGAMLLRLALGIILSRRLLRRGRPLALDGVHGVRVRVGPGLTGPVTLANTVLLPTDCSIWPEDRLRAVVAHEGAHARAGDFYLLMFSQINRAMFWFSPVAWWLHRQLTLLAEIASDDAALAFLGDRVEYARVLLDVAGRTPGPSVTVTMARPSTVERRIERVLREGQVSGRSGEVERLFLFTGICCLAALTAVSFTPRIGSHRIAAAIRPPSYRPVAVALAILDRDVGYYRDRRNSSLMVVTRSGDHLETHRAGLPPVPEYPYSEYEFFLTTVPQQNTFVTDPSGAVLGVVHHQDGTDERLDRIDARSGETDVAAVEARFAAERAAHVERLVDPASLDDDAGVYALRSGRTVTISRHGHALDFRLAGRPAHEFLPYGERDFFSTSAAAEISFLVKSDGHACALVLHEGGRDRVANRVDPADGTR